MRIAPFLPAFSTLALVATTAAQDPYPLPASAARGSTNAQENTAPFLIPIRMNQTLITNRTTLTQLGLPASMNNWDMSTFDASGRYIMTPAEVNSSGGGVFRYDTHTGAVVTLATGNNTGVRTANPGLWDPLADDFTRCDPCTLTPWNSIIWGEETTGGRLFEILNPLDPTGPFQVVWRTKIPAVSHEGMRFDASGNLYFIDEDNSGCIYKFVPSIPGDLNNGQAFVLSVDAYANDPNAMPNESWSSTSNRLTNRFGPAHWVPMTDANGNPLTATDPFVYVTADSGRAAADELLGTPYGRPEDMDVGQLANGNECIYVATTSENRVISIELTGATTAIVRDFVNYDTINLATGIDVNPLQNDPYTSAGSGTTLGAPDNIAIDAWGSVYIIEDNDPGDIWKAVDADRDGVAEAIGLFASLGISGSEPTGLTFDPTDPYSCIVNIQHPASGNDATWRIDTRPYFGSDQDLDLASGVNQSPNTGPGEFVKSAHGGDVIVFTIDSPHGGFDYAPFALALQATVTTPVLSAAPLWLDPMLPIIVVGGGITSGLQYVLPPQGASVALLVPLNVSALSVIAQGVAFSRDGILVATDAHEIVF